MAGALRTKPGDLSGIKPIFPGLAEEVSKICPMEIESKMASGSLERGRPLGSEPSGFMYRNPAGRPQGAFSHARKGLFDSGCRALAFGLERE